MYLESAHRATQSHSPQYFIATKSGMRPIKVPPGESPLVVQHRGRWHAVFRGVTDEEYFAAHPDMPFRLSLRRLHRWRIGYYTVTITTRDPEVYADGDKWDAFSDLCFEPGTPRERLIRACLKMLTDPNRLSGEGSRRLMAKSDWWESRDMSDAELWRLAMRVIEPEVSAYQ